MTNKDKVVKDLKVLFCSKNWVDKHQMEPIVYTKDDIENIIAVVHSALSPTNDWEYNGTELDDLLSYIK